MPDIQRTSERRRQLLSGFAELAEVAGAGLKMNAYPRVNEMRRKRLLCPLRSRSLGKPRYKQDLSGSKASLVAHPNIIH